MVDVAAIQSLNCCNEIWVSPFEITHFQSWKLQYQWFLNFVPQLNWKEKCKTFHVPVCASNKTEYKSINSPFHETVKISIFRSMFMFLVCCKTWFFSFSLWKSLYLMHEWAVLHSHGNKQTMVAETIPSAVWERPTFAIGEMRTL